VLGLFQGMLSPLAVRGVLNAWLFAVFDASQRMILAHRQATESSLTFSDFAACGALAGLASAPLSTPMELVKTQLQVQQHRGASYRGTIAFTLHAVRTLGFGRLARGLGATIVRETPAYAAYYSVYFSGKRRLMANCPGVALWMHQVVAAMARRRRVLDGVLPDRCRQINHASTSARKDIAHTLSSRFRHNGV
jgi:hypothetical protein